MKIKILIIILFLISQSVFTQSEKIEITYERKSDNSVEINYKKNVPGSYSITIEFNNLENSNSKRTYNKVIKYSSGTLLTLKPSNKNKGISFSYKTRYIIGNPKPKINNDITYVLPFKMGKNVEISEASNLGEQYFGSEEPIDWKSFVVLSNESDTIYSMRRGIVVEIIDTFDNDDKFNKTFTSDRNSILIEHKDGTYASYTGFDRNKIFVKLGQEIYPQTILGKLEKFNSSNYRFDFNIFHYLENLLDDNKSTLTNRIYKRKYLNPNFFIENNNKKITSNNSYMVSFNEEIKLQEFSKREKKKYKKNPNDYE